MRHNKEMSVINYEFKLSKKHICETYNNTLIIMKTILSSKKTLLPLLMWGACSLYNSTNAQNPYLPL